MGGHHAGRQLGRGRGPRPHRRRRTSSAGTCWAAGPPATARAAHHRSPARATTWPTSTSTPGRPRHRRAGVLAAAGHAAAAGPARPGPSRRRPRRDGEPAARASRPCDVSAPGPQVGTALDVPRYSQMVAPRPLPAVGRRRRGLVLADVDLDGARLLRRAAAAVRPTAWVPDGHADPWVDHAARTTYDAAYDGTGNWPFNTAYAAPLAGDAFVTRLRSLREAERFIAAGIPLVASISFGARRAERRPDLGDQRPPAGDRRLHRRRRRRRQRPRRRDARRRPRVPTTAASSRTPGCRRPAASSTSSTTPPTRCPLRPPRPTGSSAPPQRHTFWSLGRPLRMTSCAGACERREETSRHYQRITHQGPCGKTHLVADNLRSCPPAADWS